MSKGSISILLFTVLILMSCGGSGSSGEKDAGNRGSFERLDARRTGITFANQLTETEELNVLSYEYFYNGGGVAIGDINNDGLPDLYFSANMLPNKLYLNKGDLNFEDITEAAGVAGRPGSWNTGVSMVDINADGYLDIYLCYSGDLPVAQRRNELYLNNGDATFTEKAAVYGLDVPAYTTQALFFDYDRDNDLDVYLLNHNIEEFQNFDASFVKKMKDKYAGDQLLRNDNGRFVNVTEAAGIINNPLGFGLGVAASDLDNDGWLDLYVSNDYIEEDYLYMNKGDGTFSEELEKRLGHIPHFSMGSDIADYNNDGRTDILALDMLPEDNRRQKLLFGPDKYEKYQSQLRNGYYHQVMRNMLQLNNGDGTFSEVGQLAGISNTDWSWAALFADFDNDGWKDLFISNGYLRDYTNRDFMDYYADQRIRELRGEKSAALMEIINQMESSKTHNYIFRNNGDLSFSNKVADWSFDDLLLTNGAGYADLDLDGDLDLVLNNINEPAAIYENQIQGGHYLRVKLQGSGNNRNGIGARVELHRGEQVAVQEFIPVRGFQSAMHLPLHFGLPAAEPVERLVVNWPDGRRQVLQGVSPDRELVLDINNAGRGPQESLAEATYFKASSAAPGFEHRENTSVDFKRQALLPWMLSTEGPALARADVNKDGREDLFIGGAKLQAGALFLQQEDGSFIASSAAAFRKDIIHEDIDAAFFDADGDADLDLYVVSGGYDFLPEDLALQDRLYLNDGAGNFERAPQALPRMLISGGCVAPFDFDGDGDMDLFVGGRLIPGNYPLAPKSHLLRNDGLGIFTLVTEEMAPELLQTGMVTDAEWIDADGDSRPDLVLAGEWMPLRVFRNGNSRFFPADLDLGVPASGWWSTLHQADLDNDGDPDLVAGNLGANHQMQVNTEEPATIYYGDFDDNGSVDPILTYYIQGKEYPAFSRDELFGQLVSIRKKFTDYESYAEATIEDILSPEQLEQAGRLQADFAKTIWIENREDGNWTMHELPNIAQAAPVYAIATLDADRDGRTDLLLAGNRERTRANWGRWDANYGQLFLNRGEAGFEYVPNYRSGLSIRGDVRGIAVMGNRVFFVQNNGPVVGYEKQVVLE